ncbi:MAG TPA: alpha/beta fold hydrolase [Pyrinomonadaceae bacterium]|nr:alpha/beta fold hydrolase [Pyrinomonadaceae bacterium]
MTRTLSSSRNLAWPRPNPRASMRLFCFPYAGGGTHVYQQWWPSIPGNIEFCAINLPGRGIRIGETPYYESNRLAKDLADDIAPFLDKPYAFFGHSMGAIVSFELSRQLRARSLPLPLHLFVSGCHAPHLPDPHPIHHLPEDEFLNELFSLGGLPQEILESKELMELILPGIRADFTLIETYPYVEEAPLPIPMTAFGGTDDPLVDHEMLDGWRIHTANIFELVNFPGNHFFINTSRDELLATMMRKLSQIRAFHGV